MDEQEPGLTPEQLKDIEEFYQKIKDQQQLSPEAERILYTHLWELMGDD